MAIIHSTDVFTHVPSEIIQQILTEAVVNPNVSIVCARWRGEILDMTSKTFAFIVKVDQKKLTEEQIQRAKTLFIKAVKDHRHYYPTPKSRVHLFSTPKSKIHSSSPLVSIERYCLIMADLESPRLIKKAENKMTFWGHILFNLSLPVYER